MAISRIGAHPASALSALRSTCNATHVTYEVQRRWAQQQQEVTLILTFGTLSSGSSREHNRQQFKNGSEGMHLASPRGATMHINARSCEQMFTTLLCASR
eukprot:4556650-Amphidinium_carterae.1